MRLQGRMKGREHFASVVVSTARDHALATRRAWALQVGDEAGAIEGACLAQAALIERALGRLLEAHQLVQDEIGEDAEARQGHEDAWGALAADVHFLQARVLEDAGDRLAQAAGLLEPTPQTPAALDRYVEHAVERLVELDAEIEPRFGPKYRTSALAQRLAGTLVLFRKSMAWLERETQETRAAYEARDEAIASFERALFNGCRVLEGLFRQAELYEYAERVRPSSLRIQGRLGEDPLPS